MRKMCFKERLIQLSLFHGKYVYVLEAFQLCIYMCIYIYIYIYIYIKFIYISILIVS